MKLKLRRNYYCCQLALVTIFYISILGIASARNISLLPNFQLDKCTDVDTLWIYVDSDVINMEGAFFKISYDDSFITPTKVIKGPALNPPGNFTLFPYIYPDSILINLAALAGHFNGPGQIIGVILTANNEITSTHLSFERSALRDTLNQDMVHQTTGADIQIDCTIPPAVVNSPPSGDTLNYPPTLNIRFRDNLGLNRGYYQMDGCAGAWTQLWSYNSGSSDTSISWTVPSVSQGLHTIYFKVTDDAGNANGDTCTYSWSFTYSLGQPTVQVTFPPSGGIYNYLPALTIHFNDDGGLNRGYYQIDSCSNGPKELEVDVNTAALWHFNENTGTTAYDATANDNDGTISGATWTTGRFGSGLSFDGSNDYVQVPAASSLNITGDLTLEAWIKPDVLDTLDHVIVTKRDGGYICNYQMYLNSNNEGLSFYAGGYTEYQQPTLLPTVGQWNYVAIVRSGTTLYFYLNNQTAQMAGPASLTTNSQPVQIGSRSFGSIPEAFDGTIDEVRITKRALTPQEIAANYAAGAWTQLWSYNSGSSDTTISWTVPSVSQGLHNVYFKVTDDAGNANDDTCTYSWNFTYRLAFPKISLFPSSQLDKCADVDTLWIYADSSVVNIEGASFKISYDESFITPTNVIKGPALNPPGNFTLFPQIYPDSILIDLAVLVGHFNGPGQILGIVLTADHETALTSLSFARSILRDTMNQDIAHETAGAEIQVDCIVPTAVVNSPPSGDTLDYLPTLSISFHDNVGLNRGYYQTDGCTGAWTEFWSYNSNSSDTNISWTVPSLPRGSHNIYFKATDDAGNRNNDSCTYFWNFVNYSVMPAVPVLLAPADQSFTCDSTPTFEWGSVSLSLPFGQEAETKGLGSAVRPITYTLQYASDPYFTWATTVVGLSESTYTVPDTAALKCFGYDLYYWRVEAVDMFNHHSGFQAQPFSFTLFKPGDVNGDGIVDIGDIVYLINYVFYQGSAPAIPKAADVNFDAIIDIGDIVYLINYVFYSGPEPSC